MILGVGLCLCVSERSIPESMLSMCKGPEEAFENLQVMPCPSTAEQEEIQEKHSSPCSASTVSIQKSPPLSLESLLELLLPILGTEPSFACSPL